MSEPTMPTFSTWSHENLVRIATELYLKAQDQHELIQHLRQLIASAPQTEGFGHHD